MATKTLYFSEYSRSNWTNGYGYETDFMSSSDEYSLGTATINPSQLAEIPDNTIITNVVLHGEGNTNISSSKVEVIAYLYRKSGSSNVQIGNKSYSGEFSNKNSGGKTNSFGGCSCSDFKSNSFVHIYGKRNSGILTTTLTYKPLNIEITYSYSLDMNGSLDGVEQGGIEGLGAADVTINGQKTEGATDYYNTALEPNTTYLIDNIRASDNYFYTGETSYSGVLSQSAKVVLPYITIVPYVVNFDGNGNTNTSFSAPSNTGRIGSEYTIPSNPGFIKKYTVTFNFNGSGDSNQSLVSSATMNGWEDWGSLTASDGKVFTAEEFDAPFYANTYPDLKNTFGYNKKSLLDHYISNGKSEGRKCIADSGGQRGAYPPLSTASFLADNGGSTTFKVQWSDMSSVTLINASRNNYVFIGWFTAPQYGERVGGSGDSYIPKRDVTLYAHWASRVTYEGNGSTDGSVALQLVDAGSSIKLQKNSFNKTYSIAFRDRGNTFDSLFSSATFEGWYTLPEGGDKIGDAESNYTPNGNITLYAHWSAMAPVIMPQPRAYEKYVFAGYWNSDNPSTATKKYGDAGDSYVPTEQYTVCLALWDPVNLIYVGNKRTVWYLGTHQVKEIYKGDTLIYYRPGAK